MNVKYFTAEDEPNPDKINDRQKTIWWQALRYRGFHIIEGKFRSTYLEVEQRVRRDRKRWREKETDTALVSHMIADCNKIEPDPDRPGVQLWTPGYDEAVLLSGDSDFVPAVKILVGEPFRRRVLVLLPPNEEKAQASAQGLWKPLAGHNLRVIQLTKADLTDALLPEIVVGANARERARNTKGYGNSRHGPPASPAAHGERRAEFGGGHRDQRVVQLIRWKRAGCPIFPATTSRAAAGVQILAKLDTKRTPRDLFRDVQAHRHVRKSMFCLGLYWWT